MIIDITKIITTPKDKWEAIDMMTESQQQLFQAIHIMDSMLENSANEFKESHEMRMKVFLKQFEK